MLSEPAGRPGHADSFVVRSGAPKSGWWPLLITADAANITIFASNAADPVPNLLAWLECLVAGSAGRVLIDEEGEQTEIYVYPKEKGLVRFVASRHGAPDDQRIDVLLRLHDVVARFYAAIQQLAKDTIAFEQEWMFNFDPESVAQPPFISEVVEGFLSKDDTD